jgi:hypothetical protein
MSDNEKLKDISDTSQIISADVQVENSSTENPKKTPIYVFFICFFVVVCIIDD